MMKMKTIYALLVLLLAYENDLVTCLPPQLSTGQFYPTTVDTLKYSTNEPCGGSLEATSEWQNLTSPYHPNHYRNNERCYYEINSPQNTFIILNLTFCELETNFDFLNITSNTGELLLRLSDCNARSRQRLYTSENKMFVNFTTDSSVTRPGFIIAYRYSTTRPVDEPARPTNTPPRQSTMSFAAVTRSTISCDKSLTATDDWQVLSSPKHPDQYENNLDCNYVINAPSGKFIIINITTCQLELSYDFLNISSNSILIFNTSSNNFLVPYNLTTSVNQAVIRFKTDGSVTNRGFNMTYKFTSTRPRTEQENTPMRSTPTVTPPIACDQTLTATKDWQNINSPNHPGQYGNNLICNYVINAPSRKYINLIITACQLELSYDFLNISSGSLQIFSTSSNNFPVPHTLTTDGNQAVIRFKTDISLTNTGFNILYKFIKRRP